MNGQSEERKNEHATRPGSVLLALISGVLSLLFIIFTFAEFLTLGPKGWLWGLAIVLFLWSSAFAIGFLVWGWHHRDELPESQEAWKSGKFIGHPTLEMVGGVTAAIIAALTFLLIFADQVNSHDVEKKDGKQAVVNQWDLSTNTTFKSDLSQPIPVAGKKHRGRCHCQGSKKKDQTGDSHTAIPQAPKP